MIAAVEIPLGKSGRVALVDACDAERVLSRRWRTRRASGLKAELYYAQSHTHRGGLRTTELLHRFILRAPGGTMVDHRNGNRLDCRRENLRFCTPRQNLENIQVSPRQRRGELKGIYWDDRKARWIAQISGGPIITSGKLIGERRKIKIGTFRDAESAARAYDAAARAIFGEFAATNYPEST